MAPATRPRPRRQPNPATEVRTFWNQRRTSWTQRSGWCFPIGCPVKSTKRGATKKRHAQLEQGKLWASESDPKISVPEAGSGRDIPEIPSMNLIQCHFGQGNPEIPGRLRNNCAKSTSSKRLPPKGDGGCVAKRHMILPGLRPALRVSLSQLLGEALTYSLACFKLVLALRSSRIH